MNVPELFGSMVFDDATMKERLPKETYKALKKTINSATLQIFNQNGKLILEKDATALINSYTVGPIEWNPLSDSGERLGAGIYFARMLLTTSSDEIATKTIKMVVFSNNK